MSEINNKVEFYCDNCSTKVKESDKSCSKCGLEFEKERNEMHSRKKILFGAACLVVSIALFFIGVNTVAGKPDIPEGTFYLFFMSLAFFITGIVILISKRSNEIRVAQDSQRNKIFSTDNNNEQKENGTRNWSLILIKALGILFASAILVPILIYLFISFF